MKPIIRTSLAPFAILMFIIGFVVGQRLIFSIIGAGLLIFSALFYSHRKQRVRYWIQGYKTYLENNGNNEAVAVESVKQEFCASKYVDDHVCNNEYQNIETLVEDIIKREFRFERLVQSPISSPSDIQGNLLAYTKVVKKVRQEIADVKDEILKAH